MDVVNVNVISFVPRARPVFRPRIDDTEPEAPILKSGVSTHNNYWCAANAKPVSPAKMCAETVFGNPVTAVTSTFVPSMMFMLPMLCAVVLPNISRAGVIFTFVAARLAHVFRPMRLLLMWLLPFWSALVRPLLLVMVFAPLLLPIRLVSVRALSPRRGSVFLLTFLSLLLVGTSLPSILFSVLCVGNWG
jgi:hypothetical protein